MKILIKGIYSERAEDAPFIGALICADKCNFNCKDCFNQYLKYSKSIEMLDTDIINEVKSNPFNEGIILAGLEWTLQPEAMLRLIELALSNQLKVILYTGYTKSELQIRFPILFTLPIYIKCGKYNYSLHTDNYNMYGVKLASTNQEIIKCGD